MAKLPARKNSLLIFIVFLLVVSAVLIFSKLRSAQTDLQLISQDLENVAGQLATDNSVYPANESCAILTPEVAAAILKGPAQVSDLEQGKACSYIALSNNDSDFAMVTLVIDTTTTEQASYNFITAKETAYGNNVEKVEGLAADDVYYAVNYNQLSMLKGNHWLILSLTSNKYPSQREGLIAAADLILPRVK